MSTILRARLRRGAWAFAALLALLVVVWVLLPKPPLLEGVAFSRAIFDRRGTLLRVTRTADDKIRLFTPLADIPSDLVDATLFLEDRHYFRHPGVNPLAAVRAAWRRLTGPGRGGASTISMQVARLRWRLGTRTLGGKLAQMFRAVQLERHYTKAQVLEAYLNLAPYGGTLEGVGAAALVGLGRRPRELSRPEAATLAVIPQSPARRALRPGRENPALTAAHARLWARWRAARPKLDALGGEYAVIGAPRVFRAPHFAARLASGPPGRADTTLDLTIQQALERRVADFLAANAGRGLENAAALLVETRTMEVLAHVGSADFNGAAIHGQVDGTRRPRSPGSALKPFVYALALDQGLIHPRTLLADAPRRFGDYDPENFDREFAGPLPAGEALARSRNVPAVALAARLAAPGFAGWLRAAGVPLPRADGAYGLTLALGGAEISLERLAMLYAALAHGGRLRPLRRLASDPAETGRRIVSPEAAWLTLEMLLALPPPGAREAGGIAWKTGTSHGFRDAWTVAVGDGLVLAVWVGNFDGRPNPAFVGREAAAPLCFQLLDAVRALRPPDSSPAPPPDLRRVPLCAVSGQAPTAACRHCAEGWVIPGVSPIAACEIHREVLVDAASGLRVGADDGVRPVRREVFEVWPHDLQALFRRAGVARREPPPFLPGEGPAPNPAGADAPRILSPRPGVVLRRAAADGAEETVALRARPAPDAGKVYWFAGRDFLGATAPLEPLAWNPAPGTYEITAIDDRGRAAARSLTVESAR